MNATEITLQSRIEQIIRPNLKFLSKGAEIGRDDDLGELGLDSLAAINLLFDIESEFGVTIPDEVLDENTFSSIAHLEAMLIPLTNS